VGAPKIEIDDLRLELAARIGAKFADAFVRLELERLRTPPPEAAAVEPSVAPRPAQRAKPPGEEELTPEQIAEAERKADEAVDRAYAQPLRPRA